MKVRKLVSILLVAVFSLVFFGTDVATAETNWPTRAVSVIVPFNPGGDTDFYARLYARFLEAELGQPFIIINVAGAGGTVGSTQVSIAASDGYTVLFNQTGSIFINNLLDISELHHSDFAIACIAVLDDTNVLVAGRDAGFVDATDFLERARANPNGYSVATTISSFSYYTVRRIEVAGNFQLNAVDVGGAAAMVPSLLGNHTELAMNSYGIFRQLIINGDVIPLMTVGEQRNPHFPDVPTVNELGMVNANAARAYFFAFPKGTDDAILHRLSDAAYIVQQNPDFAREIRDMFSVEPFFVGTAEAQAFLDDMWYETEKFGEHLSR